MLRQNQRQDTLMALLQIAGIPGAHFTNMD